MFGGGGGLNLGGGGGGLGGGIGNRSGGLLLGGLNQKGGYMLYI